jgi:hypothetical protein
VLAGRCTGKCPFIARSRNVHGRVTMLGQSGIWPGVSVEAACLRKTRRPRNIG